MDLGIGTRRSSTQGDELRNAADLSGPRRASGFLAPDSARLPGRPIPTRGLSARAVPSRRRIAATGYRIDVATNSRFTAYVSGYVNLDVGNSLSRLVTGLRAGTSYYVRLRAYNGVGTSAVSKTLTVKTAR